MTKQAYELQENISRIMDIAKEHIHGDAEKQVRADISYDDACNAMFGVWGKKDKLLMFGKAAAYKALKSLKYSVGESHSDYKMAEQIYREL
jgi:hypothetical protein